jgi:hypothetical protein
LFWQQTTNKTVTGIACMWELLIADHLDQSFMINKSEILSRSQVQFITLFFGGAHLCCTFYQPRQAARIWCRKTNFLRKTGTFWLLHCKFLCLESHTEHQWRCSYKSGRCKIPCSLKCPLSTFFIHGAVLWFWYKL